MKARPPVSALLSPLLAWAAFACPATAHASFLPPALMDTAATYLAWFILIAVPIAGIVLFWLVHILPEKIAHKRHHPQKDAIQTLCLLSLVFGGLLWPIAWLWAYTKPVGYRMAYGTDKHDEYFVHMAEKAQAGELTATELQHLREELDAIADSGAMPPELRRARAKLEGAKPAPAAAAGPAAPAVSAANGAA
jgi:CBS domain containing-hemolysin-like protein